MRSEVRRLGIVIAVGARERKARYLTGSGLPEFGAGSSQAVGDEPIDRREPAVADRVPLKEGLVLRIRKLHEGAVGQQPCGSAMRLGAQKGLDPGTEEQDRGVDPGEKLFLGHPAARRSAESSQPPVGASTRSAVWAENQAYCRRQRSGSFDTRLRSGVRARSERQRLAPGRKQMPRPVTRARPVMHRISTGGRPPARIPSIGADRIAASNRPGYRRRQSSATAPPIEWPIRRRGRRAVVSFSVNEASSLASRSKCLGRGRLGKRLGRSEPPCPRQSRHHTECPRAARSPIVSKYFSMHSPKPPTITHSARGSCAGRCPQRSRVPSFVGRLPQTKPVGSRNRAAKAGTLTLPPLLFFAPC